MAASSERYLYDFRVSGLNIDNVCQDPTMRTQGCVVPSTEDFNLITRPRYLQQRIGTTTVRSPIAVRIISFPARFTLYTPREEPGGDTYNHELHHMVTAHRLMTAFKDRYERRVRSRLVTARRLSMDNSEMARSLLSEAAIEAMVDQEYEPFVAYFGRGMAELT